MPRLRNGKADEEAGAHLPAGEVRAQEREAGGVTEPGVLMCFRDLGDYRVYEGEVALSGGVENAAYVMMVPARQTRQENLALMHEEAAQINAERSNP